MVNVPPIPPLLCSTPPPIDFGEDDEDVDVMPPTLNGVDDDDFCGFLTVDNKENNESVPSVCDLPPVSIYDSFAPPDEEDITKQTTTTSLQITEAFNFNIKNTSDENKNNVTIRNEDQPFQPQETIKTNESTKEDNQNEVESQSYSKECSQQESHEKSQDSGSKNFNKSKEDLTIESANLELRYETNDINEINIGCMRNTVSIEDIEDDLSDDELYSPKKPKNFMETDNLDDYFIIQEIEPKTNESKHLQANSFDSLDNNETSSFDNENDNDFKSFSSSSFPTQNLFDMPPPLDQSIDDDTDDFADFADFQDFSTAKPPVHNIVPVKDISNKQHFETDSKVNSFNEFTDCNTIKESCNVNKFKLEQNINAAEEVLNGFKDSGVDNEDDFDEFTSHITEPTEKNENKQEINFLEVQNSSQEISNANLEDSNTAALEDVKETEENCIADKSFGDFSAVPEREKENVKKYDPVATDKGDNSVVISPVISNDIDDDFGDFANFQSHQEIAREKEIHFAENNGGQTTTAEEEHDNSADDDDDFGDFYTAQPKNPNASSLAQSKTSQNTISATPTLSSQNLNERILKILHLMFSPSSNDSDDMDTKPKTNKIQEIPFTSIDSAKALEYQWLNSDTRHFFIKSLGIDSRNILFGENWNPSLPRFAANLSFNPLKPMKPAPCANSVANSSSTLNSTTISPVGSSKPLDTAGSNLELNSKSLNTAEQTNEDHKDNNLTTMPYAANETPSTEPASLTIFENPLENEKTFSKTPPISEMESLSTFSSPSPSNVTDIESNNTADFELKETAENFDSALNINEVVVTSTFTGSFKETHIYTPSKTNDSDIKQTTTPTASTTSLSPTKASPIDFDYEKAAMGVIIDETVVKKEYRDVEYNPPFSMESLSKPATVKTEIYETNAYINNTNVMQDKNYIKMVEDTAEGDVNDQCSDDFTEFQSVQSEVTLPTATVAAITNGNTAAKPKTTTVAHGGMILSPAILIPQAISMENQQPKIEWGDSTATINPEELARIEELFPEPKSLKSSNASNSSQKSTPTHQMASTPSISATVANKELEANINNAADDDDDDWSDFVSVNVVNNTSGNRLTSNNNILTKSPANSPFKQRSPIVNNRMPSSNTIHSNSNNDDEWSDFVSSAPPTSQPIPSSYRVPQFNSGAWQNANFYNNPLSMYHKGPLNVPTTTKSIYNNNNIIYNNISQQPYQIANNIPPVVQQVPSNVYQQQQQIHVMQNFSTAPVPTPERLTAAAVAAKSNQFQVGSAKVAPSIALIPDLGFVAPAIPTHTSFINSLPKPSISSKK